MWIKICGMTTPEAVDAAINARVNAIGFVFAPSVRNVSPAAAAKLASPARGRVQCIAVTRHPTQQLIDDVLAEFRPDVLQTDIEDLQTLQLPKTLAVLPVVRAAVDEATPLPPRVLFEGPVSGTGVPFDWTTALSTARRVELVLAGGLNPLNVTDAIRSVRPFGVDVSSGVEERPGIKSGEKIHQFVEAVRAAFQQLTKAEHAVGEEMHS